MILFFLFDRDNQSKITVRYGIIYSYKVRGIHGRAVAVPLRHGPISVNHSSMPKKI